MTAGPRSSITTARQRREPEKAPMTTSRRAFERLPVRRKMRSVRTPPATSPSMPPKKAIEVKIADCLMSRR